MPYTIQGSNSSNSLSLGEDYAYQYPDNLDLRPDSELHRSLVGKLMQRVDVSSNKLKLRHSSWREVDKTLTAYIPLTDAEKLVKEKDSRAPVSIVFPHSYSILETLTAFMSLSFATLETLPKIPSAPS